MSKEITYPDIDSGEWAKKHGLKIKTLECDNCGNIMKTTKPFYSDNFIGLAMPDCECGKNKTTSEIAKVVGDLGKKMIDTVKGKL